MARETGQSCISRTAQIMGTAAHWEEFALRQGSKKTCDCDSNSLPKLNLLTMCEYFQIYSSIHMIVILNCDFVSPANFLRLEIEKESGPRFCSFSEFVI